MADAVDPKALETALNDFDFPASKQQLVEHVESRGATSETIAAVRSLPLGDYDNLQQVKQSLPLAD